MMKNGKLFKLILFLLIVSTFVSICAYWLTVSILPAAQTDKVMEISGGWYYYDDDGNPVSVTLPEKITKGGKSPLTLYHNGTPRAAEDLVIATRAAKYNIDFYIGDSLLFSFDDKGRDINGAVRGNIISFGVIPDDDAAKPMRAVFYSESGKYDIQLVTVSSYSALLRDVFTDNVICLVVAFTMTALGILAGALGFLLSVEKQRDDRIFCAAAFLILCGLWSLADSSFIHLISGYSDEVFAIDFYLFMLMPIPMVYFVICTGNLRRHIALHISALLFFANVIAQSALALTGTFTFFEMLPVTHLLIALGSVLCPLIVLVHNYRTEKLPDTLLSLVALTTAGVIGVVAIVMYALFNFSAYQIVFQAGIFILMSVLLGALFRDFLVSVKNRTSVLVYKKLAEHDKLTGLENRRSFDLLIERLDRGEIKPKNAAMLFMDVNFLKLANDTYGHEAGDTLLVTTAECISKALEDVSGKVYSYRIGGDEFCAVVTDPELDADELVRRVQSEIEKANASGATPIKLSVACGCSFISENGVRKTISSWKREADSRMYENKIRLKQRATASEAQEGTRLS